jgi:uncharacterized membrane protein
MPCMSSPQNAIWNQIRARPLLITSIALGLITVLAMPTALELHTITRMIIGWNVTTCIYLLLGSAMVLRSTPEQIHQRARVQDDGKLLILSLVILAALFALSAVVLELAVIKELKTSQKYAHMLLAGLTIVSSWGFTHMIFALHYAHDYYVARAKNLPGGLDFPNDDAPDYADFLYFSFVIGTSGQTADVAFTSKGMRRVGLVHCVLAFVFNTTVLALTINIAASLI